MVPGVLAKATPESRQALPCPILVLQCPGQKWVGRVELLFVFEETAAALGSNNLRPGGWEMGPEEEGEPWASEAMRVELSILGMQVDCAGPAQAPGQGAAYTQKWVRFLPACLRDSDEAAQGELEPPFQHQHSYPSAAPVLVSIEEKSAV
ncbi:hypothetical protein CB1_000597017 [Camelus ferus]|nr:hypothetical protein CB1_000597017 [Camelus ferus]